MKRYHEELLPDPLPPTPMELAESWLKRALTEAKRPNPDSMVLATSDEHGSPSARVVLCKRFVADPGYLVFFTNYGSRKARELDQRPRAAAVFHWDAMRRQMRIEGSVDRSPEDESDAYFATRAWQSRVGAWASRQSRPVESRDKLLDAVSTSAASFGASFENGRFVQTGDTPVIDRPPFWGGYRLWIRSLELWTEGEGRVHDRAVWSRDLDRSESGWTTGEWRGSRLQP